MQRRPGGHFSQRLRGTPGSLLLRQLRRGAYRLNWRLHWQELLGIVQNVIPKVIIYGDPSGKM
ncbi:MAG: hypothetical protein U0401_10170 [Anaerolineae bacterium]